MQFQKRTSALEVFYRIQILRKHSCDGFSGWEHLPAAALRDVLLLLAYDLFSYLAVGPEMSPTHMTMTENVLKQIIAACDCVAERGVNVLCAAGRLSLSAWECATQRVELVAQARD